MVGLDTPSPDSAPYAIHKLLFEQNILIIENLKNLESLAGFNQIEIFAFPLKLDADASPVRIVARVLST